MVYKCVVVGYDSGLNELLNAQGKVWDKRLRRYRVFNTEKRKNDTLCAKYIRKYLKGVHIENPIVVHYHFYCSDKKHDKTNIAYAFCKSFLDSLQICKVIDNDGWNNIENVDFAFEIDKLNPRVEVEIEVIEVSNSSGK